MQSAFTRLVINGCVVGGLLLAAGGCAGNFTGHRVNGDHAFDARNWSIASDEYAKYMESRPGDHATRLRWGKSLINQSRFEEAADVLRVLYTQQPGNDAAADALAEALYGAKANDELYRVLRSEAIETQRVSAWMRLGTFAQKLGDRDTAQVSFLSAARVDRGASYGPHLALFEHYKLMGRKSEALERLRMAAYAGPREGAVIRAIEESGVVYGPTFAKRPPEMDLGFEEAQKPVVLPARVPEAEPSAR
jgi:tetratricopeptide (TPR) repeat protein